jgi:hypothetical protein
MNENSTQEGASQEQDAEGRRDDRRFGDRGFGARPLPFQFQIPLGGGAPALALPLGGIGSPLAFTVPLGGGAAAPSAMPVAATTAPAALSGMPVAPTNAPAAPAQLSPPADAPVAVAPDTPLYVPPTDTMSEVELLAESAVAAAETLGRASAAGRSSSAFLESLFGKSQGSLEALSSMGTGGAAPSATVLFHAIVGGRASPRRSAFEQRYADRFLVLGRPGERLGAIGPRRGDLLIRVALGQGWGSVGVVGSHGLHRHDRLPLLGLRFEGYPRLEPGAYVHLVEPGPSYRSIEARFARRVCDQNGVVLPDTLLLRLQPSTKSAEPVEADPDAGATAQGAQALHPGQSGSAVRRAQAQLNRIHADLTALQLPGLPGCPLQEDGRFTDRMARAVLAFQQQIFADPAQWDGSIGPATKRRLDLLAGSAVPGVAFFAEAAPSIPCRADLSNFGLPRREHDLRQGRRARPELLAGRPLCPGRIDLLQSGPDGSTIDLLLWNFDIEGTYTKVQHEAALDRLIFELHQRLVGVGGAAPAATTYRLLLSGFASSTGSTAYNQVLATEREDTLQAYLQANLEKFRSIPEAPIGPLVTFERHPGGFDPNAPPGVESAHARSARVIAVPVGSPVPPPRPVPCVSVSVSSDDPTALNRSAVGTDDFNVTLTVRGTSYHVKGNVFYPAQSNGRHVPFNVNAVRGGRAPILFIAHGNHGIFHDPANRLDERGTNPGTFVAIANHRGYEYFQQLLAQMGIVSVSVDCNQFSGPIGLSPTNIQNRADLVLGAIKHFQSVNSGRDPIFGGHIDFDRAALMGHSRGGEVVVLVPELLALPATGISGITVKGVISIAPTDIAATSGKPSGFAFMTLLPAADLDVIENNGAKFYDQASAVPFKSQLYIHSANHNFFNTEWVSDDRRRWDPATGSLTTVRSSITVMSKDDEKAILKSYGCAFLRTVLLGDSLQKFIEGLEFPPGVSRFKDVHISFERAGSTTVDDNEDNNINRNTLGQPNSKSGGLVVDEFEFAQKPGAFNNTFFGNTRGMVAQSSTASGQFRWDLGRPTDLRDREIRVRTAAVYNGSSVPAGATGFKLGLEDTRGNKRFVDSDGVTGLPQPFDRRADDVAIFGNDFTKTILKTLRFPTSCMIGAKTSFDPTKIRAILLRVDRNDGRALAFDQLQIV